MIDKRLKKVWFMRYWMLCVFYLFPSSGFLNDCVHAHIFKFPSDMLEPFLCFFLLIAFDVNVFALFISRWVRFFRIFIFKHSVSIFLYCLLACTHCHSTSLGPTFIFIYFLIICNCATYCWFTFQLLFHVVVSLLRRSYTCLRLRGNALTFEWRKKCCWWWFSLKRDSFEITG